MKRAVVIAAALLVLVLIAVFKNLPKEDEPLAVEPIENQKPAVEIPETVVAPPSPTDPLVASARDDVRKLHEQVSGLLLLLKDPYRPPLGDNTDITLALTGHNRRNIAAIPTNDASIVNGQLVDRWGTPYWFHPRAPDAIDILSAGPDKKLFTDDDIASEHFQALETR